MLRRYGNTSAQIPAGAAIGGKTVLPLRITGLAMLVVFGLTACSGGFDDRHALVARTPSSTTTTPQPMEPVTLTPIPPPPTDKSAPGVSPPPGIGIVVVDHGFAFTVTRAGTTEALPDQSRPLKTAHGVYVVVSLTIVNQSDQSHSYSSTYQKLRDVEGEEFPADSTADPLINKAIPPMLNPGDRVNVQVAFDVPNGTHPIEVELHESPISHGQAVRLYSLY